MWPTRRRGALCSVFLCHTTQASPCCSPPSVDSDGPPVPARYHRYRQLPARRRGQRAVHKRRIKHTIVLIVCNPIKLPPGDAAVARHCHQHPHTHVVPVRSWRATTTLLAAAHRHWPARPGGQVWNTHCTTRRHHRRWCFSAPAGRHTRLLLIPAPPAANRAPCHQRRPQSCHLRAAGITHESRTA